MKQVRELKAEQATAAHTLDRHVSVTAGPGSGKTTVLVERYLHILRENKGLNIDQIVAITFTNRAANEMRERLRTDLDRILQTCAGKERQRWMRYKRTLDSAVISTIHGFCARLLREFPVEAQIDPQFLLLDSHDAAILLEAAVEESLTEFISRERELISRLAVGFGRSRLAEVLVQLYVTVRGQGLKLDELAQRTIESHSTPDAHQEKLAELDRTMNEFVTLGRLTAGAEEKRNYARSNWQALRQIIAGERPALADYCNAIETFRIEGRPQKRDAAAGIIEKLDVQLWGATKGGPLGLVPQICFDLFAKDYALEMIHVLKEVERRYREKKQSLAALDFDDLQLSALELLDEPAVLARASARYRFFLIDEFQDTNSVQRELTHKLALGSGTRRSNLFIVGDRKQSIYGFRGADVDVFQQTTNALKLAGGVEQPLHLNFRSQPALVRFFNHLFERLFQLEEDERVEDPAELGFVDFEPGEEQREQRDALPLVELLIDTKSPAEDDPKSLRTQAERDAKQVAQRILSLTGSAGVPPAPSNASTQPERNSVGSQGTQFPAGGRDARAPSFNYRDIALLFRAMTDVTTYEAIFRTANIPFQTVQGKGFYEREEITDLIQLLRFLDNKTDEIALAAVLRSPLGGVSDNALLALRCAPWLTDLQRENLTGYFSQPRKLFHAVRRHNEIAYLSDTDHAQLSLTDDLLSKLIERRNHYPIADLLRLAVEDSEYLTVIAANPDGAQRLANVQKLFTLAERFEHSGAHLVRDFVRYVEEFEAIGSREGEGQIDDSRNAVRLMTIHQAKGLEFPVVFIPNLHHRSLKPQEHWYALDRGRGLTVKIPDGRGRQVAGCTLESFRKRARLREHFESIRLLYVAATRAEDRLILAGVTDELAKLNGSDDNWLKLIWQKLELQVSRSGIVDLEGGTQLDVKLNLADASIGQAEVVSDTQDESTALVTSLTDAFPLLRSIDGEREAGAQRASVTQLINYQRCPRQYYFDRILRVPAADELAVWNDAEAPEPPANLTATLKGAVIHRFCETYSPQDDVEERLRRSLEEVISSRQAQLADRLFEINETEALRELLPLAQNYLSSGVYQRIESAQKMFGELPDNLPGDRAGLWSELSFRLRRPLAILSGTIDKLLISPAKNGAGFDFEIIDFKTNRVGKRSSVSRHGPSRTAGSSRSPNIDEYSRRAESHSEMAQQFAFDFNGSASISETQVSEAADGSLEHHVRLFASDYQLQMQAYALAVRQLMPTFVNNGSKVTVTLHFLEPKVEFQLTEDLLAPELCAQAVDNAILQIISSTEPEQFPVRPAPHCRMCNYLELCAAGREWIRDSHPT